MEYLIVFSVAAMMIAFVWIIGPLPAKRITAQNAAFTLSSPVHSMMR